MFKLEEETKKNEQYRVVLSTNEHSQLVLMSVDKKIPDEIHKNIDQFFKVEDGEIIVYQLSLSGEMREDILKSGDSITIPAGTRHEVHNIGPKPAKLYTLYSYATKVDAPH